MTEGEFKKILDKYNISIDETSKRNEELREILTVQQKVLKEEELRVHNTNESIKDLNREQTLEENQLEGSKFEL